MNARHDIAAWAQRRPWSAALQLAWLVAVTSAGAWAASLLARSPMLNWTPAGQALLGVVGAVPLLLFWGRHALAVARGEQRTTRRMRGWFGGVVGGVVGVTGIAFVVSGLASGMFAPLARDPLVAYDRLGRLMARAYPYSYEKGVDWPALLAEHRPAVAAAADDDAAYAQALGEMLLKLNDAHTGVTTPWANVRCCFVLTEEIEGQAVVTVAGRVAREAGLVRGAVLHRVDGRSVEAALADVHPSLRHGSTPWQRRHRAYAHLLSTPQDAAGLEVTFEGTDGAVRTAFLAWDAPATPPDPSSEDEGPLIFGQRLPSGLGLIQVPTLSQHTGHDLVAEFDAVLDALLDAPGLILDLRGNGGGDSRLGDRMAGRLLSEPVTYGEFRFPARLPQRFWQRRFILRATPRAPVYAGPVAVLIDTWCMSSAEDMLAALLERGNVITVGRRTAGASGNPITVRLPGDVRVRYSSGAGVLADGSLVEGRGFQPDIAVAWTIDDVRQERDPDIAAAARHLLQTPPAD